MNTKQLLFLRHAETAVTESHEWHGNADPPISALGRVHAMQAASALATLNPKVDTIVTSDARRAFQTAIIFGDALRCSVAADADLRERDLGEWSGLTLEQIERAWPGHLDAWREGRVDGPPGGETEQQVATRVTSALLRHAKIGSSEAELVIAHAGLLRGLLACNGLPDQDVMPLGGRWLTLLPEGKRIIVGDEAAF